MKRTNVIRGAAVLAMAVGGTPPQAQAVPRYDGCTNPNGDINDVKGFCTDDFPGEPPCEEGEIYFDGQNRANHFCVYLEHRKCTAGAPPEWIAETLAGEGNACKYFYTDEGGDGPFYWEKCEDFVNEFCEIDI